MKPVFAFAILALAMSARAAEPEVNVILWFDTEDYLLPADDDAVKRLAEMLTQRHIHATFKVVGEKARVLEKRGRRDVIAALKKHDIGYHTDFHSVHPTPAEYEADCGWEDGIREFARREGDGAADVRRVFGVKTLSCYGQPGSSWAGQAIGALPRIGVAPCYVDGGSHVGLKGKPFWFANALVVYDMAQNETRGEIYNDAGVEPSKKKATAIADRLRKEGGGLISIYYHPNEWIMTEFWDAVNFSRGANPPREQWKPEGQVSAEETEARFRRFTEYLDHLRALPNVRFVTASDLPKLYPDVARTVGASEEELIGLAQRRAADSATGVDTVALSDRIYSAADQFELLTLAVGGLIDGKKTKFPLVAKGLFGPDASPPASREIEKVDWPAFRDAVRDVREFVQTHQQVPSRVFIGAEAVPPADFLVALARVYQFNHENGALPTRDGVTLGKDVAVLPTRHVAKDSPDIFNWIIHKQGFHAPKIMELARLQAWTLKPALRGK